jgi:hypothetical protein
MELGGPVGRTFDTLPLTIAVNTGSNSYGWSVAETGTGNWLALDKRSGATSGVADQILLSPLRTGLQPGTYAKSLAFTVVVNGDTLNATVPVTFNLDTHRLIASENGVGFTSTPSFSRLTHTIKVNSNFSLPVAWTASSSDPWLTVTPSGQGGGNLQLTANANGLPSDQLATATITISSSDTSIVSTERVRVGLWVGSTTRWVPYTFPANTTYIQADPIRPYVYFGSESQTYIRVLNVHTGVELPPIASVGTNLSGMAISSDGDTLWVGEIAGLRIIPVDLNTQAVKPGAFPLLEGTPYNVSYAIGYARINGLSVLLPQTGHAYFPDGTDLGVARGQPVAVTGDGKFMFYEGIRWALDYTSAYGGRFSLEDAGGINLSTSGNRSGDMVANRDGSRVYMPSLLGKVFAFNGLTLTELPSFPLSAGTPRAVALTYDGRIFCSSDTAYEPGAQTSFWAFRSDGSLVTSTLIPTQVGISNSFARSLVATSDGHFAVSAIGELRILPVGE